MLIKKLFLIAASAAVFSGCAMAPAGSGGASAQPAVAAAAERLGTDRVLWASDYPHPEYHPGVVDELREHIAPLDDAARARVLAGNAIDCYGLAAV